uniref:UPF0481 protein At3g47200 n=1 Tax=Anthurium amnicola TaxID=1678845 RepID=A0A1D1XSY3_9ARAE
MVAKSTATLKLRQANSEGVVAFMDRTPQGGTEVGIGEDTAPLIIGGMSWIVQIQNMVDAANTEGEKETWKKQSIYRVPACVKNLNPHAYTPQLVSFGPYHHGGEHLTPMEEHKQRSLVHFIKRSEKQLRSFVEEMEKVEQQLMDAYDRLDYEWRLRLKEGGQFLQLMIMDGCFMLEIMRFTLDSTTAAAPAAAGGTTNAESKYKDYGSNDPIFSSHGVLNVVPYIQRDMLMLENQLPLLVLDKLVAVESGKLNSTNDEAINRMVLRFFAQPHVVAPLGLHPLDVYRRSKLHGPSMSKGSPHKKQKKDGKKEGEVDIIRSAMELNEAGVRFKRSRSGSLRDIHFKGGVLSLPVVVVDDLTEYMLLNLMAFERLHVGAGNDVTSYVFFMDNLIDSAKDVSLLNSKGIIHNAVGSDKAVAKLFNTLSKDVSPDPESSLEDVHHRVSSYCQKSLNMWRANLVHTYFRNPWAFLSLAAAVFLLVLTVAQTVFSVLQWSQGLSGDEGSTPPPPPPFLAPSMSPAPR